MRKNQGVTIIELIIVMAIIGIITAGSYFGANMLGLGSAKSTVRRISSMLDAVQLENMTKSKTYYLVLSEEEGNYYLSVRCGTEGTEREKLKLVRGQMKYTTSDGITRLISGTPEPEVTAEICFKKDTGGLALNTKGEMIRRIEVSSAGRSYTIHLVEATGKHYIE
jgi:prepilin-type N-terminal cleavage/methylation domain-containing protein